MSTHPIRGKTIRWHFNDGPMAGKQIEHAFHDNGTVEFGMVDAGGASSEPVAYQVAKVGPDVYAVAYLGASGYTLTSILDFGSGGVVAFASNEQELTLQRGRFEVMPRTGHAAPDA